MFVKCAVAVVQESMETTMKMILLTELQSLKMKYVDKF